mgnify:CR=1 FL=1
MLNWLAIALQVNLFFFHFLHSFMNTICLDITTTITNVYLIFWILLALQRRPSNRTNNRIIIIGFNVYNTIVQFIGRIWIIDLVTVYVACCCFGWSIFHFNFFAQTTFQSIIIYHNQKILVDSGIIVYLAFFVCSSWYLRNKQTKKKWKWKRRKKISNQTW